MIPEDGTRMETDFQDPEFEELEESLLEEISTMENIPEPKADEADYKSIERKLESLELSECTEDGYRYSFPDGSSVIMTVPDGAGTKGPVRVQNASDLLLIRVKKDGEEILYSEDGIYQDPGEYTVSVESISVSETEKTITDYQVDLTFSIGSGYRREEALIKAPEGMVIKSVKKDSVPLITEKSALTRQPDGDGRYEVVYEKKEDPSVQYTESFILDTQPPVLSFSGDITSKALYAPLFVYKNEQDVTVTVIRDGVEMPLSELGITSGGTYVVRAVDAAGNTSDYDIHLRYGKNIQGTVWIFLAVSVIMGVIIQMVYLRKHRCIR